MTVSRSRRGGKALMVLSVDTPPAGRSRRAHAGRGLRRRARPRARPRALSDPCGYARRVPGWPEPVERVAAVLRERGADVRLEEFSGGTPTAEAAPTRSAARPRRSSSRSSSSATGARCSRSFPATGARRGEDRGGRGARATRASRAPGRGRRRHRLRARRRRAVSRSERAAACSSTASCCSRRSSGSAPARPAHGRARADRPRAARRRHARRSRRKPPGSILGSPSGDRGDPMEETKQDLDERRARRLGGRDHSRRHARPPLRVGRLRGHSGVRDRQGPRRLPAHRAHAAPARLGEAALPGDPVLGRRAEGGDLGRHRRQRTARRATCARSRTTATASSASRRGTTRSTSRSCRGRGARTSARTGCATASA